jgi:hypothetical protein
MSDMMSRRSLITGMISLAVAAPAIVRAASLMPVKVMIRPRGDWLTESRMFPSIGEFEDLRDCEDRIVASLMAARSGLPAVYPSSSMHLGGTTDHFQVLFQSR